MNSRTILATFTFASTFLCVATVIFAVAVAAESGAPAEGIVKEPAYQGKPWYGQLVFGEQADVRMWLVVDDAAAYLDLNQNGDLSELDERVGIFRSSFKWDEVPERTGVTHRELTVRVSTEGRIRISMNLAEGCRQTLGYGKVEYDQPHLARQPESAPVFHFNGPITFARYGPISFLPRETKGQSYRSTYLRLFIGSPGKGTGSFVGYNCKAIRCETGYRALQAEIEFPHRSGNGQVIKLTQALEVRG